MANQSLNNSATFHKSHSKINDTNQAIKINPAQFPNVQEAIKAIEGLDLKIEICGSWVWVFNANRSHEGKLRAAKFHWSYKRGCWYFCSKQDKPRAYRQSWEMVKIRQKYGSQVLHV